MKEWFHTVCLTLAGEFDPNFMAQIKFLKLENEILRSRLKSKVTTTREEQQRLLQIAPVWITC